MKNEGCKACWPCLFDFALSTLHPKLKWPAPVTLRVPRLKRPRLHFKACRPKWCSRQDSHPHWRRSQRRASASWATRAQNGAPTRNGLPKSCKLGAQKRRSLSRIAVHRTGFHTKGAHRSKCFGGLDTGVPGRLRSGDLPLERQACWLQWESGAGGSGLGTRPQSLNATSIQGIAISE